MALSTKFTKLNELPEHLLRSLSHMKSGRSYRFLERDAKSSMISYWQEELNLWLADPSVSLFARHNNDLLVALVVVTDLPWESRIFSENMRCIKQVFYLPQPGAFELVSGCINDAVVDSRKAGVSFLSCQCRTDDPIVIHALQRAQFLLVDSMLDYVADLENPAVCKAVDREGGAREHDYTIQPAIGADLEPVVEMVANSFKGHGGRFSTDPYISKTESERVYEEWIRCAFAGYADHIVVAKSFSGEVAGCTLWKNPSNLASNNQISLAHFSLGCVHPEHSGKNLFQRLTAFGTIVLHQNGIRFVEGPTHITNYPVQRAYKRMGWNLVDSRHSFHLWLNRHGNAGADYKSNS
jgi:hypothetical protein